MRHITAYAVLGFPYTFSCAYSCREAKGTLLWQVRLLFFLCLVCALTLLQGCASKFERVLEEVQTTKDAELRFGTPTTTEAQAGGGERREWVLDRSVNVPGQYVSREYYLGHDRDGFPVYVTRDVWVPEHINFYDCTLVVVSNANGTVTERRWRGNSCDRLIFKSLPAAPTPKAPARYPATSGAPFPLDPDTIR